MKQTAVEWYEKEINSLFEWYEAKQISRADFLITKHNIFYQAKEMEKEQIKDAYNHGQQIPLCEYAEEYYNETYGKDA
jgi:hypothetical protein